jgi:hypothetical protein
MVHVLMQQESLVRLSCSPVNNIWLWLTHAKLQQLVALDSEIRSQKGSAKLRKFSERIEDGTNVQKIRFAQSRFIKSVASELKGRVIYERALKGFVIFTFIS